jgi:hypothetical protein
MCGLFNDNLSEATAVNIRIMVFWNVIPCSLVDRYNILMKPVASTFRPQIWRQQLSLKGVQ